MDRHKTILKKLIATTDEEWIVIQARCEKFIANKLKGRILFGAHSSQRLGMPAIEYYFPLAIEKLYNGTRNWKFETLSLLEQLFEIINSLIGEEVRKSKVEKNKKPKIVSRPSEEITSHLELSSTFILPNDQEDCYLKKVEEVKTLIKDDVELTLLFDLLERHGKNYNEICDKTGWEKRKLYKLAEKLKRKVFTKLDYKKSIQNGQKRKNIRNNISSISGSESSKVG